MQDSKRGTDVKNSLLDSAGEGEDGMIWENSIETCILPYVKETASPGLMHETGCSGLVQWNLSCHMFHLSTAKCKRLESSHL